MGTMKFKELITDLIKCRQLIWYGHVQIIGEDRLHKRAPLN